MSIQDVLEMLKTQLIDVDTKLAKMLQVDTQNQRTIEALGSVKAEGPVMISTVLPELPVLGKLHRGVIAKLVGFKPINRDSGEMPGKRFIGEGRGRVRLVLYMATIVAIRHRLCLHRARWASPSDFGIVGFDRARNRKHH